MLVCWCARTPGDTSYSGSTQKCRHWSCWWKVSCLCSEGDHEVLEQVNVKNKGKKSFPNIYKIGSKWGQLAKKKKKIQGNIFFLISNLFWTSIPQNKKLEDKHNWPANTEESETKKIVFLKRKGVQCARTWLHWQSIANRIKSANNTVSLCVLKNDLTSPYSFFSSLSSFISSSHNLEWPLV